MAGVTHIITADGIPSEEALAEARAKAHSLQPTTTYVFSGETLGDSAAANAGAVAQAAPARIPLDALVQHAPSEGTVLVTDVGYADVVTTQDVSRAYELYQKHKPSLLISQDFKGRELPGIVIFDAARAHRTGSLSSDLGNSYVYMIGSLAARLTEDQGVVEGSSEYSTEDQRALADMYRDNIGEYWGKDAQELSGELLRSSRDVPQRVKQLVSIPRAGERMLDVGCSAGVVSLLYGAKGVDVVGVDILPSLIDDANKRRAAAPPEVQEHVQFVLGDIKEIELEPKSFDSVVATEFYEHLPHIAIHEFMQHTLRFLKDDGYAVISVPNRYPKEAYVQEQRHRWDWHNHLTHWTRRSLEEFMGTYFAKTEFVPIYEDDAIEDGIWLTCVGRNKK